MRAFQPHSHSICYIPLQSVQLLPAEIGFAGLSITAEETVLHIDRQMCWRVCRHLYLCKSKIKAAIAQHLEVDLQHVTAARAKLSFVGMLPLGLHEIKHSQTICNT